MRAAACWPGGASRIGVIAIAISCVLAGCGRADPSEKWGPLAVWRSSSGQLAGGGADARFEGTLHVADQCVSVDSGASRYMVLWPESDVEWNAERRTIEMSGVTMSDRQHVVMGGGFGPAPQRSPDGFANPPAASCAALSAEWFFVTEVKSAS